MLTLEIEFLAGVCFAAKKQSSDEPEQDKSAGKVSDLEGESEPGDKFESI